MPDNKKQKKPSVPDLSDLIGDDDDEDSGDDTGVFAATLERHTQHDGADHAVVVAAVKYVHKKNTKLAKRVKQLEEENDRLQNDGVKGTVASRVRALEDRWNKLIWMAMGAAVGGGGLTVGIWKLIEKALIGH